MGRAGTLVHTLTGTKPIEQIVEGTVVKSFDESFQRVTWSRVVQTFKKTTDKLVRIIIGRDTILATPEHPFCVFDRPADTATFVLPTNTYTADEGFDFRRASWVEAGQLRKGFKVLLKSMEFARVESVYSFDSTATVYNFEVENTHTYYVGTEGVLVHNDCESLKLFFENNGLAKSELLKKFTTSFSDKLRAGFVADFEGLLNDEQRLASLKAMEANPALVDFWKSFANEKWLANDMRMRYLRDLATMSAENIDNLKEIITFRKRLASILGSNLDEFASSNISIVEITNISDGINVPKKFISISGRTSTQLIADLAGKLDDYIIVPTASKLEYRFFAFTRGGQDAEAKAIEYMMEIIGKERGFVVTAGASNRSLLNSDILRGTNLKIKLLSEMAPCSSCAEIIQTFNDLMNTIYPNNTNKIFLKYGTNFP